MKLGYDSVDAYNTEEITHSHMSLSSIYEGSASLKDSTISLIRLSNDEL